MPPRDRAWRVLLRKLGAAHTDDLASVLERLTESERGRLVEIMEGRAAPPEPVEPLKLAGLSPHLAACIFPEQCAVAPPPRLTALAQATLRDLAEDLARTATGAAKDKPVRLQPRRPALFSARLERAQTRTEAS